MRCPSGFKGGVASTKDVRRGIFIYGMEQVHPIVWRERYVSNYVLKGLRKRGE